MVITQLESLKFDPKVKRVKDVETLPEWRGTKLEEKADGGGGTKTRRAAKAHGYYGMSRV